MPSKVQPAAEQSSDDEADQMETPAPPQQKTKPYQKPKKERTPAQQEAFKKALTILKEKRESKATEEKEKFDKASAEEKERIQREKFEKAKNHRKKLPPAPSYITTAEFGGALERFKSELLTALAPAPAPAPASAPAPAVKKEKKVVIQQVEEEEEPVRVIKPKAEPKPIKQLSGHELLDKLFFS